MAQPPVENQVRELRTERGLTQEDLADLVGVARQSIISIEKGRFLPSIETALRLATALAVPVEDVFWLRKKPK